MQRYLQLTFTSTGGFLLSGDVVLRHDAIVVPDDAVELQAAILTHCSAASSLRTSWRTKVCRNFWWPTLSRALRDFAAGGGADVGGMVEIGVLHTVCATTPPSSDIVHMVRAAQEQANDAEW